MALERDQLKIEFALEMDQKPVLLSVAVLITEVSVEATASYELSQLFQVG